MIRGKNNTFFGDDVLFSNHWNEITINQIEDFLPEKFPGNEDFIQFYITHNGGDFPKGSLFISDKTYKLPQKYLDVDMDVLGFYHIPIPNEEEVSTYTLSIKKEIEELSLHEEILASNYSDKFQEFLLTHFPFANDCTASTFWIDIKSGEVKYLDFEEDFFNPEAAFVVASSFLDFCKRIFKRF